MHPSRAIRCSLLFATVLLLLGGCLPATRADPHAAADAVRQQDLGGLPYHPLVYHLDLSILSYQLYAQTLVWPFDSHFEESNRVRGARDRFMQRVRAWAATTGPEQVARGAGLDSYRGPGVLAGFDDNPRHDPIVYRYDRLHPWSAAITNADGEWIEYLTPDAITRQIRDVVVCYRQTGRPEGSVVVEHLIPGRNDAAPDARDVLLAFEGGTGDKGEPGQPASQSLMGFVLLRFWPGSDDYDVHIAFRGSRSGVAARAFIQAFSDDSARGNPDWITDLGYDLVDPATGGGAITTTGGVSRGIARSVESTFPQLFGCLGEAAGLAPGSPPRNIYVTGHSLGGGLAQLFVSAVLLGDRYGPGGAEEAMPNALRGWPWHRIKLISFSAPRVGDALWAEILTTESLEARFFSTAIDPVDRDALTVADPTIVPRLVDSERPAAYRVLISTDPVTTEKIPGGKHVGSTVYADEPALVDLVSLPDVSAHEPVEIRNLMLASLDDPRIPPTAWRYREMTELNPDRDEARKGSLEEFVKLWAAVERYYRGNDLWFDQQVFRGDVELFRSILRDE